METIIYKEQRYNRNPDSKRRQHRAYFWRHDKWKEAPVALHRQIWIDSNGPIPKGHIIHHKDGNTLNNLIENLESLSPKDHAILHMKERKVEKNAICETCLTSFKYFSIRKAKFCSYKCYSIKKHNKLLN
jgi:hypothetical protein